VQALAVGPVLLLGAPGDISGELALAIKENARARGYQPVVTSFAGRYIGYLLPERYYDAYRDNETRLMSMFGPANGPYLMSLLEAATDRMGVWAGSVAGLHAQRASAASAGSDVEASGPTMLLRSRRSPLLSSVALAQPPASAGPPAHILGPRP
jgi:hypothetical protein